MCTFPAPNAGGDFFRPSKPADFSGVYSPLQPQLPLPDLGLDIGVSSAAPSAARGRGAPSAHQQSVGGTAGGGVTHSAN